MKILAKSIRRAGPGLRRMLRDFLARDGGGMAMILAAALPVIAVVSVGGIELAGLSADRAQLQDAADAAATAGAKELTVSSAQSIVERAKAMAASELASDMSIYDVTYEAAVTADPAVLTVEITAHRDSFFGNMLPPGGFTIKAKSVAASMGSNPLCVLTHAIVGGAQGGGQNGAGIQLENSARMEAPACMVQSNDDVEVLNSARLFAAAARAGGLIRGSVTPAGEASAPLIPDPFADYPLTIPTNCPNASTPTVVIAGAQTLQPGVHCGGLNVSGDAVLTLAAGEHYFIGDLKISGQAQLIGTNVVLVFDEASKFHFTGNARISLEGRTSGSLAGFAIITTRTNSEDFEIDAGRAEKLLGTIYIPNATLVVEGNQPVAAQSAWTVIVAKQLRLRQSPTLVINANYATSNVPVPSGVGMNRGVKLIQ